MTPDIVFEFEEVPIPQTKRELGKLRRLARESRPRPKKMRLVSLACANCGEEFEPGWQTMVYCSLGCHDEAKAVRYLRARFAQYHCADVELLPGDIQEASYYKLWWAINGGYDEKGRRFISTERRQEVRERDENKCVICGAVGAEVDHLHGDSDRLQDLRLLCDPCHNQVTTARLSPLDEPWQIEARESLLARAVASTPERACDASDWQRTWRQWRKTHGTWVEA